MKTPQPQYMVELDNLLIDVRTIRVMNFQRSVMLDNKILTASGIHINLEFYPGITEENFRIIKRAASIWNEWRHNNEKTYACKKDEV